MKWLIILLLLCIALSACSSSKTCTAPFYEFEKGVCCLDENNNKVCDRDEGQNGTLGTKEIAKESTSSKDGQTMKENASIVNVSAKNEKGTIMQPDEKLSPQASKEKILKMFDSKVNSISYNNELGRVLIKFPYVSLQLKNTRVVDYDKDTVYIDTLYLNMQNRTATATCETRSDTNDERCKELGKKIAKVSFQDYKQVTPYDWIELLRQGVVTTYASRYEKVEQRIVDYVVFQSGNNKIELWLDTDYGVPVKARSSVDNKAIIYSELALNSVNNNDISPDKTPTTGFKIV